MKNNCHSFVTQLFSYQLKFFGNYLGGVVPTPVSLLLPLLINLILYERFISCRSYDVWKFLPDKITNLQKEIHRNIFMVYLRMATHKESKVSISLICTFFIKSCFTL